MVDSPMPKVRKLDCGISGGASGDCSGFAKRRQRPKTAGAVRQWFRVKSQCVAGRELVGKRGIVRKQAGHRRAIDSPGKR